MKRGSLFFIGLISAIITIISLNAAFGSRWNGYNHYSYRGYHRCYHRYNNHYYNRDQQQQDQPKTDTASSNY